jgi:hypothetical protein
MMMSSLFIIRLSLLCLCFLSAFDQRLDQLHNDGLCDQ